ncbi:MAG: transposase zinc-binding domain-containing protein, partial [Candidatus Rokubacteria bacterium]|nr:transposase zinc-binding domain-containing protein [Candidatus Rokubacteria bacterium]
AFVRREFEAYLTCGILGHGLLRLRCERCGDTTVVAFSCKGRAFCPSCGGRRMSELAAHLVDHVLPHVPIRQWVFTVPVPVRYQLAFDAALTRAVLRVFVRTVFSWLRQRAARRGIIAGRCGAVTAIQRFGGALQPPRRRGGARASPGSPRTPRPLSAPPAPGAGALDGDLRRPAPLPAAPARRYCTGLRTL